MDVKAPLVDEENNNEQQHIPLLFNPSPITNPSKHGQPDLVDDIQTTLNKVTEFKSSNVKYTTLTVTQP